MNIKKQLKKIADYHEVLRKENERLNDLVGEYCDDLDKYKIAAYRFVNFESPDYKARDEFKELLGDDTFIGGCFTMGDFEFENIKLREENARLYEALRWHPVSETPKRVGYVVTKTNSPVDIYTVRYYFNSSLDVWSSKLFDEWCYIPEREPK